MRTNTNTYFEQDSFVEIVTLKNEVILVDDEDFSKIRKSSWYVSNRGYVCTRTERKIKYLHRILMNPSEKLQVDHINHNKLDNRKINLRIVTNQQNHFNRSINKNNKSGAKGVYFNKKVANGVAN